jgi:hypothetical protein
MFDGGGKALEEGASVDSGGGNGAHKGGVAEKRLILAKRATSKNPCHVYLVTIQWEVKVGVGVGGVRSRR